MNRFLTSSCALAVSLAFAVAAQASEVSRSITLYEQDASVTQVATLEATNGSAQLVLPTTVDPESLRLEVEGASIAAINVEKIVHETRGGAVEALKQAERKLSELGNLRATIEARLEFCRSPRNGVGDVAELRKLDAYLLEQSASLNRELESVDADIQAAKKQIALLKEQIGLRGESERGNRMVVTLVDDEGRYVQGKFRARIVYQMGGCGWRPMLHVNAQTEKGKVEVTQLAVVEQKTGEDWTDADLTLATGRLGAMPQMSPLSGWTIGVWGSGSKSRNLSVRSAERGVMAEPMARPMPVGNAAKIQKPVRSETSSSQLWSVGERKVIAGARSSLVLEKQVWNADFYRLIRPKTSSKAFLAADIALDKPAAISGGEALFCVDGHDAGSGSFRFMGAKGTLTFGPDPYVSAVMRTDTAQSGSEGFIIGKRQTYDWNWLIRVSNAHDKPVAVRIEEPEPRAGDKQIEISTKSEPPAENRDHVLTWNLTVPSGEKVIRHGVHMEAPADMEVRRGR